MSKSALLWDPAQDLLHSWATGLAGVHKEERKWPLVQMVKPGNSALTTQQGPKVWSLQNPPQMQVWSLWVQVACSPKAALLMHHHYQVLGSGGVLIGVQWARSQPPSIPLPFAWSSITPSLQVNKAPKLRKVGWERPQNPMTSQTWLFSQGDRDVTPALPWPRSPWGAQPVSSITHVPACLPVPTASPQASLRPSQPVRIAPANLDNQESLMENRPSGGIALLLRTTGLGPGPAFPLCSWGPFCQPAPSREGGVKDPTVTLGNVAAL